MLTGLAGESGGEAVLLRPVCHRVQLVAEGVQPGGQSLLLRAGLGTELTLGLCKEILDLVGGLNGDLLGLVDRGRCHVLDRVGSAGCDRRRLVLRSGDLATAIVCGRQGR